MIQSAVLSNDRKYRYSLFRDWEGAEGYVMFIGLNPSTADETKDDPTIRRCIGFAREWGYGALCMVNLFAFRATNPADMKEAFDPIGKENDSTLLELADGAEIVVAAWGIKGSWLNRDKEVQSLIPYMFHLGLTKEGYPKHPLYLPKITRPIKWNKNL